MEKILFEEVFSSCALVISALTATYTENDPRKKTRETETMSGWCPRRLVT
jgi:hypothetical protein